MEITAWSNLDDGNDNDDDGSADDEEDASGQESVGRTVVMASGGGGGGGGDLAWPSWLPPQSASGDAASDTVAVSNALPPAPSSSTSTGISR